MAEENVMRPIPVMVGRVMPPADMIEASRKSLSPEGFNDLMREVGGRAPTPAELVRKVEEEQRHGNGVQRDTA